MKIKKRKRIPIPKRRKRLKRRRFTVMSQPRAVLIFGEEFPVTEEGIYHLLRVFRRKRVKIGRNTTMRDLVIENMGIFK